MQELVGEGVVHSTAPMPGSTAPVWCCLYCHAWTPDAAGLVEHKPHCLLARAAKCLGMADYRTEGEGVGQEAAGGDGGDESAGGAAAPQGEQGRAPE